MLLHGNLCYKKSVTQKCCSSQVSTQDEYTLLAERETSNALVVVWSGNEATLHRLRLSAYSRDCSQRILDSRLYPSKRSVAHTIRALIVSSCVVSSRVLRRPHQSPFRVLTSRKCGEIQANGDEPDQFCCCKFFICEQSDCVEKPGDTHSFKSTGWIIREA